MVLRKWWAFESLPYFTGSHLQIATILLVTYEIFQGSTFESIHQDLDVFQHAIADYRRYAIDVLVDYVETHSEKVGEPVKIVKIDKSKIGKRKFKRGHFIEAQWVFGGVEHESGHCFIVAVPDRTSRMLLGLIETWIEPGILVISDCWRAYQGFDERLSAFDSQSFSPLQKS